MKKAVLSNRIYMNRTHELHEKLLEDLTYKINPINGKGNPEIICNVSRINRNILSIPIGRTDLIPKDYEIVDKRTVNNIILPEFKYNLRENQQEIYEKCNDSSIIIANPGWGKTYTSVSILQKLSQKTLIVVNTKALLEQWEKEVTKCLNIIPGIIGNNKFNIDPTIVIATIQTLRKRVLEISKMFGTMILDECHHVPAPVFKTIVDAINCRYKIGLTATPYRKDGKHILLNDYISRNWLETKDENRLSPTIVMVDSKISFSSNNMVPWANRLNDLYKNQNYMELVVNIADIQYKKGHQVLVIADRVEFLHTCQKILHENSMVITGNTKDRDFINSGMGILFGSTRIFAEGIDLPSLSCVILAVPINNETLLEQIIGRVCRVKEGKKNPEVIDILLDGKTTKNQSKNRIGFYIRNNYKIKRI